MIDKSIPYSALAKTNRQILADILPLAMPLSLHIEPTNVCNFRCVSCPQALSDYKETVGYYQKMDFALYEKILHDVLDMGQLKALKLFGYGEPMLNPEIGRMVRVAKELQVAERIEFTSNVTLLTEKMAYELIDGQLDYLRVSIYSLDQATHRSFTQSKFHPERIYENLKRLRELRDRAGKDKPFIYIKMFDFTTPEEAERFRLMYQDIADEIAFEIVHNMSGYQNIEQKLGIDIPVRTPKSICPLPFYMSAVAANGDVTVCCIDWSFSAKVGNLREQSLREIWFGEKLQKFRQLTIDGRGRENESCRNCTWSWSHPDNLDGLSPEKKIEILNYYKR